MRRFRQSLLATVFLLGVAAPLAWSAEPAAPAAAEQTAPTAPAAQSTQRTSGSVTGAVSAPSANEFTLNYNGGSVKVLTSGVTAPEKAAITEGTRVTVVGTLDQTQRAVIAQKVAVADPNTPTSGAAKTAASAAPTADTESKMATDSTAAEDVTTAENEAAPSAAVAANAPAAALAAPRQQMAAADAERLNLAPDANLPQEVVAEISDGNYTTADLNRAALAAMRAAPSAAG